MPITRFALAALVAVVPLMAVIPGSSAEWVLVARDVAWSADGNRPGSWAVSEKMCASQIKLVHQSGYVNCRRNGQSNYGCNGNINLAVHITDEQNACSSCSIAPAADDRSVTGNKNGWWDKRGYNSDSPEVILDLPKKNYCFDPSDQYHIWHGEDKNNNEGGDNHGTAKDHVYLYVETTTQSTTTMTVTSMTVRTAHPLTH
jgi:hypothetical protein